MLRHVPTQAVALLIAAATQSGCRPSDSVSPQFRTTEVDVAVCAFGQQFTTASTNDYFPIGPVGRKWVFEGKEGGTAVGLTITIVGTETVGRGGNRVTTSVLEEHETEDGVTIEISRNFYAENSDGTVCYFGEDVDILHYDENGEVVDTTHEGAWRANEGDNFPGIFMPANPTPGMEYLMEGAPDVAADQGLIMQRSGRIKVPAGTFDETIRVRETNLIDGTSGYKTFAKDVGLIIDGPLELVRCSGGVVAPCTP